MPTEGKLREAVDRKARAEALLRDELIVEAFETLEREYLNAFKTSGPNDAQARERAYALLHGLEAVQRHLRSVVEDGKVAQRQLDEAIQPQKRRFTGWAKS